MSFYLGHRLDPHAGIVTDEPVLYDPRHLTTHGLIFGMTGSGKTGLSIGLLEEAARADIPCICIDPKGDLANLALCWPDLPAARFAEWTDPSAVEAAGGDAASLGAERAARWREGLASAGLDDAAIEELRERTRITVYTPGSTAGVPVSLLDRFDVPDGFEAMAPEDRSELVTGLVSAVLGLVDVDADPLTSREAILLANILTWAWERGQGVELPELIRAVAQPPFERLGVFELDEFYPSRSRNKLAMQLNGLVASPSFAQWRTGESLDVEALLTRSPGGSRTSVFYIAHLDDAERMSFVTLLLERLVAWMRTQPGSSDLRALVYFDEVFGYLPPHPANPSSKRPLLTLLKQARAFGLGTVLATQNPVDIDYKAITNAGTWMVGKLQTEQDKDRILDGLMSANAGADRRTVSSLISGLDGREFLLSNAHVDDTPVFKTRFVMSYLRGPLTRSEVARLAAADFYNLPAASRIGGGEEEAVAPVERRGPAPASAPAGEPVVAAVVAAPRTDHRSVPPTPAGVTAAFLVPLALRQPEVRAALGLTTLSAGGPGPRKYRAAILARAAVDLRTPDGHALSEGELTRLVHPLPLLPSGVDWTRYSVGIDDRWLRSVPEPDARFEPLPAWLDDEADVARARERLLDALAAQAALEVPACPPLSTYGAPGEELAVFRDRLARQLGRAAENIRAEAAGDRDLQASALDREIAELRELLAMDRRELAWLAEKGAEESRVRMARDKTRLHMEDYKRLRRARAEALGAYDERLADTEFSAMDKLAACRMVRLVADRDRIAVRWFGILWVPER